MDKLFGQLSDTIALEHIKYMAKYDFSKMDSEIIKIHKEREVLERFLSEDRVILQLDKVILIKRLKTSKWKELSRLVIKKQIYCFWLKILIIRNLAPLRIAHSTKRKLLGKSMKLDLLLFLV